MKNLPTRLLGLGLIALTLSGCMMPGYKPLVASDKDVEAMVWNPIYGWARISSRGKTSDKPFMPFNQMPGSTTTPTTTTVQPPITLDPIQLLILQRLELLGAQLTNNAITITNP